STCPRNRSRSVVRPVRVRTLRRSSQKEAGRDEGKSNADFTVGEESEQEHPEDGPSHEGRDSFPNAPPPNIRRVLTVAQQLALAEKRSKLRRRPAFILLD
ncbi:unnamed protein product, partial [Arctia plantaginis]